MINDTVSHLQVDWDFTVRVALGSLSYINKLKNIQISLGI